MARSVPEWIGKTHDSQIPPRVKLRVFERFNGICYLSGRKIRPGDAWAVDHIIPLIAGGDHREFNLAPVLIEPHKEKTRADVAEKSIVAKKRKTHLGIRAKKRKMGYRKFDGTIVKPRWG